MTDSGDKSTGQGSSSAGLRPVERAVRKLADVGMADTEIAWRFRRTPAYVARVLELAELKRDHRRTAAAPSAELRPIERHILRARESGTGPAEIAARLRRTPSYVLRVERFANFKQDRGEL